MNLNEELDKIDKHFEKITKEELNDKLLKLGLGRIKCCSGSGFELFYEDTKIELASINYKVEDINHTPEKFKNNHSTIWLAA